MEVGKTLTANHNPSPPPTLAGNLRGAGPFPLPALAPSASFAERSQFQAFPGPSSRRRCVLPNEPSPISGHLQRPAPRSTAGLREKGQLIDRKSTRLNSSHLGISYAVF